jgi:hypothetical protein
MKKQTRKNRLDMAFIDYGEVEHLLVSYKIGRVNLDEVKRYLRYLLN